MRNTAALIALLCVSGLAADRTDHIQPIDPPEDGFFTKELFYDGIPIKAPSVVDDKALFVAQQRMKDELQHLPNARYNLRMAGAELQIIGKDQVTSDLPDYRSLKGKPFDGNLTVDQRTRGLGGRHTSCGEENLLDLPNDRYLGRDICKHEFGHCIQDYGFSDNVKQMIQDQYKKSLAEGHWVGAYSASNVSEYFAELTMWYFGTHGDLHMKGDKPANGPEGFKKYDSEAFQLFDAIYSGRVDVEKIPWTKLTANEASKPADSDPPRRMRRSLMRFENHSRSPVTVETMGRGGDEQTKGEVPPRGVEVYESRPGQEWTVTQGEKKLTFTCAGGRCLAEIR